MPIKNNGGKSCLEKFKGPEKYEFQQNKLQNYVAMLRQEIIFKNIKFYTVCHSLSEI